MDCSCSNHTAGIFGRCRSKYERSKYKSGPMCYVNEPSNCTDLVFSKSQKRWYSWEACVKSIKGNWYVCVLVLRHKAEPFAVSSLYFVIQKVKWTADWPCPDFECDSNCGSCGSGCVSGKCCLPTGACGKYLHSRRVRLTLNADMRLNKCWFIYLII